MTKQFTEISWKDAVCESLDPDIFFTDDIEDVEVKKLTTAMAKDLCSHCPVLEDCREWGLEHEKWGMWGGLTPTERRTINREREKDASTN